MYLETDSPINVGGGSGSNSWNESWIWIILIFALLGFGGGWGGNRGSSSGVSDGYILTSDFANIERKLDGVNQGLCDGFYAMNTGMLNGFAGITNSITTSGYETRNAIADVSAQMASCCCDLKSGQKDTQYAIAVQTNDLQKSIVDSYRALHDEIVANRIEDKNAQIVAQQNEINALRLRASQVEQNEYLVATLRPSPIPAYAVSNPYCCTNSCGSVI